MPEKQVMLAAELLVEFDYQIVKPVLVQRVGAGEEIIVDGVIVTRRVDVRRGEVTRGYFWRSG